MSSSTWEELEEATKAVCVNECQRELGKAYSTAVRIALAGQSGVGKSSLINTLRGLHDGMKGSAPTGVAETTDQPRAFPCVQSPEVIFFDLPGVSKSFPIQTYAEKVELASYDLVVLVTAGRITLEADWDLIAQLIKMGKPFLFVRNKFDCDLAGDAAKGKTEQQVMSECKQLPKTDPPLTQQVYVLSANWEHRHKWEMPAFADALIDSVPASKKEAMALAICAVSPEVVSKKEAYLKKRLHMYAIQSGLANMVPLVGVGVAVDMKLMEYLVKDCIVAFSITQDKVEKASAEAKARTQMANTVSHAAAIAAHLVTPTLLKEAAKVTAGTVLKCALPILGSVVTGVSSVLVTEYTGRRIIGEMKIIAGLVPSAVPDGIQVPVLLASSSFASPEQETPPPAPGATPPPATNVLPPAAPSVLSPSPSSGSISVASATPLHNFTQFRAVKPIWCDYCMGWIATLSTAYWCPTCTYCVHGTECYDKAKEATCWKCLCTHPTMKCPETHKHEWVEVHFGSPTWCDHCGGLIKNPFGKQGSVCRQCKFNVHFECCKALAGVSS